MPIANRLVRIATTATIAVGSAFSLTGCATMFGNVDKIARGPVKRDAAEMKAVFKANPNDPCMPDLTTHAGAQAAADSHNRHGTSEGGYDICRFTHGSIPEALNHIQQRYPDLLLPRFRGNPFSPDDAIALARHFNERSHKTNDQDERQHWNFAADKLSKLAADLRDNLIRERITRDSSPVARSR